MCEILLRIGTKGLEKVTVLICTFPFLTSGSRVSAKLSLKKILKRNQSFTEVN